jgi:signal transduction histidine kinase
VSEAAALDTHALGRLLRFQSTFHEVTSEEELSARLSRELGAVPGVVTARLRLTGLGASWEPAPPPAVSVAVRTGTHVYGGLELDIGEPKLFALYEPFIHHLATTFALWLENRAEHARWLVREQEARERSEASEARLRFLADASRVLGDSLDYDDTLTRTVRLAIPTLGDWCSVDVEEQGHFRRVTVAHLDPSLSRLAQQALRFAPTPANNPSHPPTEVSRWGGSILVEEVDDAWMQRTALSPEHLEVMRSVNFKSVLSVSMYARGRSLGILTFLAIRPGKHYTRADLETAEDLARRAALAVDNARLFREAQQAVRLRDEFLGIASHELKTPLTPLSIKLQAMAREAGAQGDSPFAQRISRHVEVGRRQVARLTDLVNALLDVSRISEGRLTLTLEPVDLPALVEEVAERFEPVAELVDSRLEVALDPDIPVAKWDRLRLEQVVSNLLSNALKYGAGKPVHLELRAQGAQVRLTVRDEGIGIEPEVLSRIFGKFERGVSERHYGGLGLGLYVTRHIVEAMGGTVEATSTPGQGATFTVQLPLRSREEAARP